MTADRKDTLRAGVFVVVGVAVFTLAIFLLGQKSALFSRTASLFVQFDDISGLAVGAPVRLAGLEIGSVAALRLSPDLHQKKTQVELVVQSRYLPRIRANSEAFIDSNGLLGDKIVNISMGDPAAAALVHGASLRAGESVSFDAISATAARALSSAASVVSAVEELVGDSRTVQLRDDVARAAGSLARLLDQAEHGDGVAHRILYDAHHADHVAKILENTRALSASAQAAVARVDDLLAEVERGDGTLHALIYERQGGSFVSDLDQLAASLRRIVEDVEKGRGTVGGLLKDPTVYEDLKTMLGNVQRNVLFKALVRFTVEREQLRRVDQRPRVEPAANVSAP